MKSGPNISDVKEINKMLAAGAEPEGISQILGIQLKSILMYTEDGKKKAIEARELAAVAGRKRAKDLAIAQAKAEAQAEVDAEEEKAMLEEVKKSEKDKIKHKKSKAA